MAIYRDGRTSRGVGSPQTVFTPPSAVKARRAAGPGFMEDASLAALAAALAHEMASTDLLSGKDLSSVLVTEILPGKEAPNA